MKKNTLVELCSRQTVHHLKQQFQLLVVATSYNGGMVSKGVEIEGVGYRSLLRTEKTEREVSNLWALTNLKRDFGGSRVPGKDVCVFRSQKE
jgi:hypothetical protein